MKNQWSGYLGFLIAVAGAAIGLGNIWKFPYMVGENGGSSFVIIYMVFVFCVGIPLMLAEMVIGRCGQHNPISSFSVISDKIQASSLYAKASWILIVTALCILSFYSVIAGFSLAYLYKSILGNFTDLGAQEIKNIWTALISSPIEMMIWNILFLFISVAVVIKGVQEGLERANRILMPILYLILVVLVLYAYSLEGFEKAVSFMFGFRVEELTSTVIIAALGHAFFSLAIGAGCLIVYGSYLPEKNKIGNSVFIISIMSILVAMMAGIAIFTVVFTYDLPPTGGPGLMFEILPVAFAKMPYGYLVGAAFFIMLIFAAWTSSISFIEVLVAVSEDKLKLSRTNSAILVGIFAFILGLGSIFSFNYLSEPIFWGRNFFYIITDLSTNILLPISSILIAVFVGHVIPEKLLLPKLSFKYIATYKIWIFLMKWVVPICIIIVMLNSMVN